MDQSTNHDSRVCVIGAGGHAAVVASTLIAAGNEVVAFYDDDPTTWGTMILGIPVVGPISALSATTCSHFILGIGSNATRKLLAEKLDFKWATVVHPFAWVHPDVSLGKGTVVCAGAIIQPGAKIGSHVILNTKASVDHHCHVGDYAHIAVAHLAGGASIGEGAFMALGCTVLPGIHVGAWATVGAGALVTKDVAPNTTVVGAPARALVRKQEAVEP
jgi:sugar O-acyltransferase (sialic acid O-acetyltransferase NeuD family)